MKYLFFSVFFFFLNSAMAVPKTNPDIGVNILLLGKKSLSGEKEYHEKREHQEESAGKPDNAEHGAESHEHNIGDGFFVQEVEMYFKSSIDPYWSGNVFLGVSQHGSDFELDLEEAFVESLFIPSLTIKAGKFYTFLGRHNNLHTHYYPFIDPPLINQTLFGFHGWSGTGVSLAYLSSLPWYSELIAQVFYSHDEKEKLSGVLFFKNLWDLNDSSTLELNMSYGAGVKDFKHLYDVSLVWKRKTLDNTSGLAWTTEVLRAISDSNSEDVGGLHSYIQWQFLKRWRLEGRAEYLHHSSWNNLKAQKYSALIASVATEYSAIRLQYNATNDNCKEWGHGIAMQTSMRLGAHPAHLY